MADDNEVVIVSDDGTEHVFPAGFDPKRAAAIVKGVGNTTFARRGGMTDAAQLVTPGDQPITQGPRGSERTRVDTNIIGVDHDKILQGIADWASKLSPRWQKPAAFLATLPADALASLAEMLSAPETVATAGAKPAMAALDAAGAAAKGAPAAAVRGAAAVADTVSPDVVGILSPRAGKALQVAQKLRDASARGTAAGTLSDLELARKEAAAGRLPQGVVDALERKSAPAAAAPTGPVAVPSPAPVAPPALDTAGQPAVTAPVVQSISPQMARNQVGLALRRAKTVASPAELDSLVDVVRKGADPVDTVAALMKSRMTPAEQLAASPSFAGLPTDAERDLAVVKRNVFGQWQAPTADAGARWRSKK